MNPIGHLFGAMRRPTAAAAIALGMAAAAYPACGAPPGVGGFNPQTMQDFVANGDGVAGYSADDRMRFTEVAAMGAALWRAGILGMSPMRDLLGPGGEAAYDRFLPPTLDPSIPRLWTSFFNGAVFLVGRGVSDRPVLGFYNPLLDGWVLVELDRRRGALTATRMMAASGDWMRAQGRATARTTELPSPVLANYAQSAAAFQRLYPAEAREGGTLEMTAERVDDYAAILARADAMVSARVAVGTDPALGPMLSNFVETIRTGDALAMRRLFPPQTTTPPEWLAGVAMPVRQAFIPLAAFAGNETVQVAFGSLWASRLVVLVDIRQPAGGQPVLQDVIMADYAQLSRN